MKHSRQAAICSLLSDLQKHADWAHGTGAHDVLEGCAMLALLEGTEQAVLNLIHGYD